jgi:ferrous iron transport protein A
MRSRGWFWGRGHGRRRHRHRRHRRHALSLADLREGEAGTLESLDLPGDVALRLMEMGFLPGSEVVAGKTAPGGDPQVFRIDGSEIALRRETAQHLILKPTP